MKAIVYHGYGLPDVLKCEEVEKPVPKDDQVLIKVHGASVNPLDWRDERRARSTSAVFRLAQTKNRGDLVLMWRA